MRRAVGFAQRMPLRRLAVVLGTNEVASAIAVYLRKAGRQVILSQDSFPPVLRRGMAFHDALFGDPARLEGIVAERIDFIMEAFKVFSSDDRVAITTLGLTELLVLGSIDVLVDARMQKDVAKPDLRGLAKIAVGVGAGFHIHGNCDLAIATTPENGTAMRQAGLPEPPGPGSIKLSEPGAHVFVRAEAEGRWRTSLDIGVRVYKGVVIGHHEGQAIRAPADGVLRGLLRDATEVPEGHKLLEIDLRNGRAAKWNGIDERPRQIAAAARRAVDIFESEQGLTRQVPFYL